MNINEKVDTSYNYSEVYKIISDYLKENPEFLRKDGVELVTQFNEKSVILLSTSADDLPEKLKFYDAFNTLEKVRRVDLKELTINVNVTGNEDITIDDKTVIMKDKGFVRVVDNDGLEIWKHAVVSKKANSLVFSLKQFKNKRCFLKRRA